MNAVVRALVWVPLLGGLLRAAEPNAAQWIWQAADGPANAWVAFRQTVTLDEVPAHAVATISADTKYWLWINGALVLAEGGAGRGPSPARPWVRQPEIWTLPPETKPTDSWSEEIDLSGWLRRGENTIAVLVWYWGRETHKGMHIDSGRGGLWFSAQLGSVAVGSDATWKVRQHPAYALDSGDSGNSIVAYPVKYDARLALGDWTEAAWQQPGYDDGAWPAAATKGAPPAAPWHRLLPREVPPLVDHGLLEYSSHPPGAFPFVSEGTEIRCVLPSNRQITPYLEVEAEAGAEIFITTDNRLNKMTAHYTTRAGRQAFEGFSWMNGHTVIYRIPAGVKVLGLRYRWQTVGHMVGAFACDDPFYQRLWDMGRNTLEVCARDNFMDCPDRERALWIGDVADQASYLFYLMDESGRALLRQAIRSTMLFSDKGVFGALGPLRLRELPSQSLQFIPQGIWEYYWNTGDLETLRFAYPYAQAYLQLWRMGDDGLPQQRRGGPDSWDWYDWGEKDTADSRLIQCVLYFQALQSARTMALTLGVQDDVDWYDARLASIRAGFDGAFWHGDHFTSAPGSLADDRGNALTILAGLASPAQATAIVHRILIPNEFCSPHFEWMVEEAMAEAGFVREALARMRSRYAPQLEHAWLTTLYEKFPSGGSYNHAWNAPNTVLARRVAGIRPTAPGWREFSVLPQPLHFRSLRQVVPSVAGEVVFAFSRDSHDTRLSVTVPDTAGAVVGVPLDLGEPAEISVNGIVIWRGGQPSDEAPDGIRFDAADATHLRFRVSPGDWQFLARMPDRS